MLPDVGGFGPLHLQGLGGFGADHFKMQVSLLAEGKGVLLPGYLGGRQLRGVGQHEDALLSDPLLDAGGHFPIGSGHSFLWYLFWGLNHPI